MRMRAAPSNNGRHSMPPTPLRESTPKVTFISQVSLCLLGLVFMALAFGILIAPAEMQEAHGLDFYHAKPSALAEIRAYYFGTMGVLSVLLIAGACGDKPARMRGLLIAFGVLGAFVLGRLYSFRVDGPPNNAHAEIMWAHEALGAMAALALWWLEEGKETAWGQGLVALVRT